MFIVEIENIKDDLKILKIIRNIFNREQVWTKNDCIYCLAHELHMYRFWRPVTPDKKPVICGGGEGCGGTKNYCIYCIAHELHMYHFLVTNHSIQRNFKDFRDNTTLRSIRTIFETELFWFDRHHFRN